MGINQKRQVKTVHLSINCRLLVYRTCIPNGIQKGVDFGPFFLLHFFFFIPQPFHIADRINGFGDVLD